MNFNKPSRIQANAFPLILKNPPENMIAMAQAGTGKTACFSLGMLSRIDTTISDPQAICLCTTRELARQIVAVIEELGQFVPNLKVTPIIPVEKGTEVGPISGHILVGTPGRVMDMLSRRKIAGGKVKMLVIDEADNIMGAPSFKEQTVKIRKGLPAALQILLFSATFDDDVMAFAQRVLQRKDGGNPNVIRLKKEELSLGNVYQYNLLLAEKDALVNRGEDEIMEAKYAAVKEVYSTLTVGQTIIFVETKKGARHLEKHLMQDGYKVGILTSELSGTERDTVIADFRQNKTRVLIGTNVLSRGIDVPQVTLVINYDMPISHDTKKPDYETYLHRVGRAGRFGNLGVSLNLIGDHKTHDVTKDLASHYGKPIEDIFMDNLMDVADFLEKNAK